MCWRVKTPQACKILADRAEKLKALSVKIEQSAQDSSTFTVEAVFASSSWEKILDAVYVRLGTILTGHRWMTPYGDVRVVAQDGGLYRGSTFVHWADGGDSEAYWVISNYIYLGAAEE